VALPLVSAIIPAYNAADTIGRAIESILNQTYRNIEVVVVNDGSSDDTGEIVRRRYPQATYLEQKNAGPSVTRNHGVAAASGELVAFLDADDEWAPEKTARQVQVLQEHPEIDVLGTDGIVEYRTRRARHGSARRPGLFEVTVRDAFERYLPVGASYMLPKRVFTAVGGYDVSLRALEDADLACRWLAAGYRVFYLNGELYLVHYRPRSRSGRSPALLSWLYLESLGKWDPRNTDLPYPSPLTPAQFSDYAGQEIARGAFHFLAEKNPEEALRILLEMDWLPAPPPRYRTIRRLAGRHWSLAKLLLRIDRERCYWRHSLHQRGVVESLCRRVSQVTRAAWERFFPPR